MAVTEVVADDWLPIEAKRLGGVVAEGGGLVGHFDRLNGPGFDAAHLAPPIIQFYERTAEWRLEAWSQWSPAAWPFGWMLSGFSPDVSNSSAFLDAPSTWPKGWTAGCWPSSLLTDRSSAPPGSAGSARPARPSTAAGTASSSYRTRIGRASA